MKILFVVISVFWLSTLQAQAGDLEIDNLQCEYQLPLLPTSWIHMADPCVVALRDLIDQEMFTAVKFLALGAYNYRDTVSRKGFAEAYLASSEKHRDNCKALIEYLTMRGKNTEGISNLLHPIYSPSTVSWKDIASSLTYALELEAQTTTQYRHVIDVCENQSFVDYNLNNWLTKEFLYDLYVDQKWYADQLSTNLKMNCDHQYYGEFLMEIGMQNDFC